MEEFEFIGPNDEPALVAISSPEALNTVKTVLAQMGYKVHVVDSHPQFETPLQPGQLPGRRHRGEFRRRQRPGQCQPAHDAGNAHGPAALRGLFS